jgi:hypothetical protein
MSKFFKLNKNDLLIVSIGFSVIIPNLFKKRSKLSLLFMFSSIVCLLLMKIQSKAYNSLIEFQLPKSFNKYKSLFENYKKSKHLNSTKKVLIIDYFLITSIFGFMNTVRYKYGSYIYLLTDIIDTTIALNNLYNSYFITKLGYYIYVISNYIKWSSVIIFIPYNILK